MTFGGCVRRSTGLLGGQKLGRLSGRPLVAAALYLPYAFIGIYQPNKCKFSASSADVFFVCVEFHWQDNANVGTTRSLIRGPTLNVFGLRHLREQLHGATCEPPDEWRLPPQFVDVEHGVHLADFVRQLWLAKAAPDEMRNGRV
jgi:hypothetical protein